MSNELDRVVEELKKEIASLKIRTSILEEDVKILQLQLDMTQDSIDAVFDL